MRPIATTLASTLLTQHLVGLLIDLPLVGRAQVARLLLLRRARLRISRMRLVFDGVTAARQRELLGRKLLARIGCKFWHLVSPEMTRSCRSRGGHRRRAICRRRL